MGIAFSFSFSFFFFCLKDFSSCFWLAASTSFFNIGVSGPSYSFSFGFSCFAKPAEEAKPEEGAGLPDRDPALACRLVRKEGAVLLDVRTAEEFAEGHVEGAVNIPHGEIDARAAEIDALQGGDKSTPIVVYCRSGRRSGIAKQSLIDGGRSQVSNVGGLSDWSECAK